MERNTLLAIILSLGVLFAYQAIFTPPKPIHPVINSQVVSSKSITTNLPSSDANTLNSSAPSTNSVEKPTSYTISLPKQDLLFTNVGGSLHNIKLLDKRPFPITDVLDISQLGTASFVGNRLDNKSASFSYQDSNWQITKTYDVKDDNLINVRMEIKNLSSISILNNFSFKAFEIDESRMEINSNSREMALYEYSIYSNNKMFRKGSANKFSDKNDKNELAKVTWAGFRDRYNAIIVKPEFESKSYEIKSDSEKQLGIYITPEDKEVAPGETISYTFDVYAGPQNVWIMKKYGDGFEKIVAFSNFAIVEWIAQGIYYTIPFFHSVFKSWGVAIILVSLMIYGMTYPLTLKSMMSMRKMQELQPKMTALRERYKDDSQKLNTEMMEIYRREKINPLAGCLPFLIQMPFFVALYQVLWRAQYFQNHGFLWIKDLSQPDRLIIFPFYLPLIGNELNILPIVTGCLMFMQQRIMSKNAVVVDEQQAMQQKMMMYVLPVMMTCMFYKFASSWAIYFLVFYVLSTLTQWKIGKLTNKK